MSKKNRKHETETFEQPAAVVEVDPIVEQAKATLSTLEEKEKVFTAEIDRLTLLLSEQKSKLRKLHALRKQINSVLGIEEPAPEPAAATAE